jgi:hypothetical protein
MPLPVLLPACAAATRPSELAGVRVAAGACWFVPVLLLVVWPLLTGASVSAGAG